MNYTLKQVLNKDKIIISEVNSSRRCCHDTTTQINFDLVRDEDPVPAVAEDESTLVAPGPGFSNVSGMVIGCAAATIVIMVMVRKAAIKDFFRPCH